MGLMLTNPNTLGLFENEFLNIRNCPFKRWPLYYDGANTNAIVGKSRPEIGDLMSSI